MKKQPQTRRLTFKDLSPEKITDLLNFLSQQRPFARFSDGQRSFHVTGTITVTMPLTAPRHARVAEQLRTLRHCMGPAENFIRKLQRGEKLTVTEQQEWDHHVAHVEHTANRISNRVTELEELEKNPQLTDNWTVDEQKLSGVCLDELATQIEKQTEKT